MDLVTLSLFIFHPSAYFHPNTLLRWLSFKPQLETLFIVFYFAVPNRDVERQLAHTPIMTAVALPNLRSFSFSGVGTYIEAVIHRITAPRLEKLQVDVFNQPTFNVPQLLQFLLTTENFRFKSAKFEFTDKKVGVAMYPNEEVEAYTLAINVDCWQVSSAAQFSNLLSPTFSAVKHLTLEHGIHSQSSEEHDEADPTEWRKLLMSFRNAKTLRIAKGLVKELSRCLELDDGELSLELLPELQELTYFGSGSTGDTFTSFIDARQDAGRSITLVRRSPSPDPNSSVTSIEPSSITPERDEVRSDIDT